MPNTDNPNVLIISYYWPPSSGSGVQRWMYFAKYLSEYGIHPIVLTVDPKRASYRKTDESFNKFIEGIEVHKTKTLEPLKLYSLLTTGSAKKGIPQGGVGAEKKGLFSKISRYIRGNIFIPDARIGWKRYAIKEAKKIIKTQNTHTIITTGPPHSTHLIGRVLKRSTNINWIADLRDPWTEIYYNSDLLQSEKSKIKDQKLEQSVLVEADHILTIGPSMAELLAKKIPEQKDKVSYIYNGYDADKMASVQGEKSTDFMIISFVGLLSNAMPHKSFSEALDSVVNSHSSSKIKLRLVGDICDSFIDKVKTILPPNQIEIVGYVAHREALRLMKSANVLFTCLPTQKHSKIMISGKLLEYMATGNPILCIGDPKSDAAVMLSTSPNSLVCAPDQIIKIAQYINQKYVDWSNGKLNTEIPKQVKKLSRYKTTAQLAELIKKLN